MYIYIYILCMYIIYYIMYIYIMYCIYNIQMNESFSIFIALLFVDSFQALQNIQSLVVSFSTGTRLCTCLR